MTLQFAASREDGLVRLAGFSGQMGRFYAEHRNTEAAAGAHTSGLSPYLRRRMILEEEAVAAAQVHGPESEAFVREVYWRSYFKGYLELRPWIWTEYRQLLEEARGRLARDAALADAYRLAVEGRTGIDCFDAWAQALVAGNWLHNHARMWFASIWIFTLGLDWTLGVDFFSPAPAGWRSGQQYAFVAVGRRAAYAGEALRGHAGEYSPVYRWAV